MPGGHEHIQEAQSRGSRAPRAVITFLLAGALIVGVILAFHSTPAPTPSSASCSGALAVTVEAAPDVAAPVRAAAAEYQKAKPSAEGTCVTIRVTARAANETARLLGGGWRDAGAGSPPDAWIPDSTAWLDLARLQAPARALLPKTATTIATSPVVLAMPRSMAQKLGWPNQSLSWKDLLASEGSATYWRDHGAPNWDRFRVVIANPQASSASASAMMSIVAAAQGKRIENLTAESFRGDLAVGTAILDLERKSEVVVGSDEALLADLRRADTDGRLTDRVSAAPMSETAVFAYNNGISTGGKTAAPKEPLVATYPTDGVVVQTVPFVPVNSGGKPAGKAAAQAFGQALLGGIGRAAFAEAGLRAPDGSSPKLTAEAGFSRVVPSESAKTVDPATTAAALELFRDIHQRGTTLAVLDTSGSMQTPVDGAGGKTRLQVVVGAMETVFGVLADDSNLGLWQFSRRLEGDVDYRKLVPIGPMGQPVDGGVLRRDAVVTKSRELKPDGDTGLYDTALAAFRALTGAYTPGRPNQVVLLTDGKNEDPGSMSLDDLVATLQREFDPKRPVHLITIAYGDQADTAALQRISAATQAKSYPARDENSILQVVIDVLTDR
jgi:Ca-activated chloride channel homolog